MARPTHITAGTKKPVLLRMAEPEFGALCAIVFSRYPDLEWTSFARFGWRETQRALVVTLAALDPPSPGDLDDSVGHVKIEEPYTLRTALAAETHQLAVGIIHSHPEGCRPQPSSIDDDMDGYYGPYFNDFAPARPYISLIFSRIGGDLALSGRVFWRGEWFQVVRFAIERTPVRPWIGGHQPPVEEAPRERTSRLNAAFGKQAASRLRSSTVAVIGAGGTGSAAIEALARAGVGKILIVDPDSVEESNLERIHGSNPEHARNAERKTAVARAHVLSIDPTCKVEAYVGALPQREIVDAIVTADVALGCTDKQHSRLALSDISLRYLVPAIDCGVMLEGQTGKITGQIIQIIRFLSADPCALCRNLVVPSQLARELMSPTERLQRRTAAELAASRGDNPDPYWHDDVQLNTVGYLTTIAGAMAAGYAIGWLAGRFDPPFERLQMNLGQPFLDVTALSEIRRPQCVCGRVRGWADQGTADALINPPEHWPPAYAL
jgi:molybdopterin/thiamine biosynthesis adenylyltransferase